MAFKSPLRGIQAWRRRQDLALGGAAATYADKVLGYGPIAYWPLWETSGITAVCQVNSAQNGTYTNNPTLGNGTAPDGSPCPYFPGVNQFVNCFSATLRAAFNGAEGTMMIWAKNASGWDAVVRGACYFGADAFANRVTLYQSNVANQLDFFREGNNVMDFVTRGGVITTDWMMLGLTWSEAVDEVRGFYQGVQTGLTQVGLGAWAGNLSNLLCTIAAWSVTPTNLWKGWLAHCALWNSALPPASILDLYGMP